MQIATSDTVDVEILARIIARVEDSLRLQGFDVAPAKKARIIARLYTMVHEGGDVPDERAVDQLVWMMD